MSNPARHKLFYDGTCGLCDRLLRFVSVRDPRGVFSHEPLERESDTFFVLADMGTPRERLLARSDAALHVLAVLGGRWRALAVAMRLIPRPLRELGYRLIARSRYTIFGRTDVCPVRSAKR